jgi:predicted RNA-binding Zn-ribbon protein involved in translation (DUF1610 family)
MKLIRCPHCGEKRIAVAKVPRDVVVVLPCPNCHELVVLFRNKVLPLKREIIENGSFEERKQHIAELIAEFLEPNGLSLLLGDNQRKDDSQDMADEADADLESEETNKADAPRTSGPITQGEMDTFLNVELRRIDEAAYFKKHFG